MSPDVNPRKLNPVSRRLVRGTLKFEPVAPVEGPVTDGPLLPVRRPLVRGELSFERVEPVWLELEFALTADADVATAFGTVVRLIAELDWYEKQLGGAGVRCAKEQVRVVNDTVTIVLIPKNPVGSKGRMRILERVVTGSLRAA